MATSETSRIGEPGTDFFDFTAAFASACRQHPGEWVRYLWTADQGHAVELRDAVNAGPGWAAASRKVRSAGGAGWEVWCRFTDDTTG